MKKKSSHSDVDRQLESGHYARKQILSSSRLVSWVHRSRFEVGLALFHEYGGGRVVDYGCGDATFLGLLASSGAPMKSAVGLELSPVVLADCRRRFAARPGISFALLEPEFVESSERSFDTVVCMEVLEHVVDLESVIGDLARLLKPGGRLIVSVPVETGIPLLVKQTVRAVLGWRGIGDYPGTSPYSVGEMWRSLVADDTQHVQRPVQVDGDFRSHDHKGFNWRRLRRLLEERFRVDRVAGSPAGWLPVGLNSQVWFVATRLGEPGVSKTDNV